jgi:hypothetical protein
MQQQRWSLAGKDQSVIEDDDNDVQIGNHIFDKHDHELETNNEQHETLRAETTQKTARQTMIERKMHRADARGQVFT